jgi:hypothetical protein
MRGLWHADARVSIGENLSRATRGSKCYIPAGLGAVYHIFVPHGDDSWTWVATVPEPLTQEDARRMVACFRPETVGSRIRMIRIDDSPRPDYSPSGSKTPKAKAPRKPKRPPATARNR